MSSTKEKKQWKGATKDFKKKKKQGEKFWKTVKGLIPPQADFSKMEEADKHKISKEEAAKIKN